MEMLIAGREIQSLASRAEAEWWVLDDCWPLNKKQNERLLELFLTRWPGTKLVRSPKNLGLHEGWNYLCSQMPLEDDDIILGVSPDSCPSRSWDLAMKEVLEVAPDLAWVGSCSEAISLTPGVEWETRYISGHAVLIPINAPTMWHSMAFRWKVLKEIGGFSEPCNYYGHLETAMWNKLQKIGMKQGFLADYTETWPLESYHDRIYSDWKYLHAHERSFPGNFEDYYNFPNRKRYDW